MNRRQVQESFALMGANVTIGALPHKEVSEDYGSHTHRPDSRQCMVDFIPETKTFDIKVNKGTVLDIVDVQPLDRHLVIAAKDDRHKLASKFLCGHDERSWFVAAIPERLRVRDVTTAKDALQPPRIKTVIERVGLPRHLQHTRRNRAFVRQGEWFFVPVDEARLPNVKIRKNEPIRRGRARPHMCEELRQTKGKEVMFHEEFAPNGISRDKWWHLSLMKHKAKGWKRMWVDGTVYVRGAITHPDHRTVHLTKWHEVIQNSETKSRAMRQVRFLD